MKNRHNTTKAHQSDGEDDDIQDQSKTANT